MKIYFILGVLVLTTVFSAGSHAQGLQTEIKVHQPDLSGKWKLNMAKSRFYHAPDRSGRAEMSWIWIIEQKLPAIYLTVRSQVGVADDASFFGGRFTLYPDGRGDEFVPGTLGAGRSFSEWKNNKLVQTVYETATRENISHVQEFELGADRKTLNITLKTIEVVYNDKMEMVRRSIDESPTDHLVFDRIVP